MKKTALYIVILSILASFTLHKFYVSIYQFNYAEEKKMVQITARIFVDDLNHVLSKKYDKKVNLGEPAETPQDTELLKKYIAEKLECKINNKPKKIQFITKELEANVLVCYLAIKEVPKIKQLEINNTLLLELNEEQQNIVHTYIKGNRKSFLITTNTPKAMLNF